MQTQTKRGLLMLAVVVLTTLSSFYIPHSKISDHKTITRTVESNNMGKEVIKTQVVLDGATSREDLIAACSSLAKENVQLTFKSVVIRRSFFGLLGKRRISYAKGSIQLPGGSSEEFEAGGFFNFKLIRITYTQVSKTDEYRIDMIEIVD
ncbi:MAG: hypothetical protein H7Z75_21685 [Ferruginibacter sp.]|nr:hypothetical protein [Cytophagales bacterium]